MTRYVFLIPLLPLLGFLFNLTFGVRLARRRQGRSGPSLGVWTGGHGHDPAPGGHGHDHGHGEGHAHAAPPAVVGLVACGAVALSFLLSLVAIRDALAAPGGVLVETLWEWVPAASGLQVDWAYQVDPLSSVMLLVVTFVGLLIHIYSTGYMAHDDGYARYMAYLNLFMFAMLTLVLGANYLLLFVGWEGVGLCSYLLIGFWFHKQSASDAGKKAFIVNRIGDAGFLLGLFLLVAACGSLDFRTVAERAGGLPEATATLIALFLFLGACGKSAQIPLYVWLPDAMEGPTPVSALIHAATMVTAGVYMVARSSAIYVRAPEAMAVVAVVGAATALLAATIALVQTDIKRVLAYSTVSQLGYMFLACGVGAFAAAIFHLMTHAFFKALLFLGSGSVIHAMSGEQDMTKMGGLRAKLPWTHKTMLVGCLAIAGIPPLAGFFSKDEILWSAYRLGGYGQAVWAVGFVVAGLTAFYMFRLYHLTFSGDFRGTEDQATHVHESPSSMIVPLQVLALGSILAGFVGVPAVIGHVIHVPNVLEEFLHPVIASAHAEKGPAAITPPGIPASPIEGESHAPPAGGHDEAMEIALMAASVAVGFLGIGVAWMLFQRTPALADRLAATFAPIHRVLWRKYYVDEIYGLLFVRGVALGGGTACHAVDRFVVDGGDGQVRPGLGVNGIAWLSRDVVARFSDFWDRWVVDGAVRATAIVFDNVSYLVRGVQDGLVQHYALYMLIGVLFTVGAARILLLAL